MWIIALLIKGVSLVVLALAYYLFVYRLSHIIGRMIPDGPFKTALFRERGRSGSRTG